MNHLSTVKLPADDDVDAFEGLPTSWSLSSRETFAQISSDHPYLDAASRAALYEACAGLASADLMQARVDADGLLMEGSQGQRVAHPLIGEIRHARALALSGLRSLGAAPKSGASQAGAALASRRWSSRAPAAR